MTDSATEIKFFEKQPRIHPKRVSGRYRNLKWLAMILLLGIYYLVPFIRFDRGPNITDQAVLIDLEKGRAYFFWFEIWPQEIWVLASILIFSAVALFFVTSLFGRMWCGFYCPQTVWTDLFIWVERFVQGDRNARQKLEKAPWSLDKARKLVTTHAIWLIICWCTAGSFVLYFNDAPSLVRDFFALNVSPVVLTFIIGLTVSTYVMAGFAREQVCVYMCPYARFQSAMFDRDTLIVSYDELRGEPRGKKKSASRGDCIDCSLCVQVCPAGIDIREGLQMQCIACALCVDACDEVMERIDRPRGLIAYDTETRREARAAAVADLEAGATLQVPDRPKNIARLPKLHLLRPRTIIYALFLAVVGGAMTYSLLTRDLLDITLLHQRNPLFVQMSNGMIRNSFEVKVLNKSHYDKVYELYISGIENADIALKSAGITLDSNKLAVDADNVARFRMDIVAPAQAQSRIEFTARLTDIETGEAADYESIFISARQ